MRKRACEAPQDRIEHVLGYALALLRALRWTTLLRARRKPFAPELKAVERGQVDAVLRIIAGIRRVAYPAGDAPAPAELHRARTNEIHLRLLDRAVGSFNQDAWYAAPPKTAGGREPHRSRAHDQHRPVLGHVLRR